MKKRIVLMLMLSIFSVVMAGSVAYGFNEGDMRKLTTFRQCPLCDLSNAYMRGVNMRGVNLSGANLSSAFLEGTNLSGANLSGANLSGANLSGANLSGADLNGANLSGANLNGADLSNATWVDGTKCRPGPIGRCMPSW